jgi:pilus assembly protein TadC
MLNAVLAGAPISLMSSIAGNISNFYGKFIVKMIFCSLLGLSITFLIPFLLLRWNIIEIEMNCNNINELREQIME